MRGLTTAVFALFATLVAGQGIPGLPTCAQGCISNYGSCTQLDVKCICSDTSLIDGLACCVSKTCDTADQEATIQFANSICKGSGVTNLPQAATCAATTASSGSATSSATGSSSSSASTTSSNASAVSSSLSSALSMASSSAAAAVSSASSSATSAPAAASSSTSAAAASATSAAGASAGREMGVGMGMVVAGVLAVL